MENISYYDEDEERLKTFPKEEFVNDISWNLPFTFVKEKADENEDIRMPLYHQLLRRAKVNPYIDILKNSPYYDQLFCEIIKSDNTLEKIELSLYFENDLIYALYGSIRNLVGEIINYNQQDEFYSSLASMLVDVSKLDIDEETRERIIEGIGILIDKDFDEMNNRESEKILPKLTDEQYMEIKENNKKAFIEKVNNNRKTK